MELKEIVKKIYKIIEDKKGDDIKVIDISKISSIADYFIIAGANNINQVQAISDEIDFILGKEGILPKAIEGNKNATWMLLDYNDIVVHIFLKEDRVFYDLERIWRDGTEVEI
ncbi:iojap-like protein [Lachnoanaerobaculum saburreum F0468]|jgi:iojap-like protein|uniref:Ribosomal silencing factor RsfS n=1 Tax=Lachnoanaerobaculum saburreum F0468 TaxID=1095750 RepID=I0R7C4_9FIRM|nr:ribosome silencing factor [Lachnoanaerobaculum saburreum]EIC95582.1 iojap-like protein [Lachnoanaerobaculum saburreum F0468]RKW35717.1 MAG: ribosome silencing factor [Lachnospiraceae bacterium]